jgi:hypothetical protein
MLARKVSNWLCVAVVGCLGTAVVASCGSSTPGSNFQPDASGGGSDGSSGGGGKGDATAGKDGGLGHQRLGNDSGSCNAKSCAELGYNCGHAVTCGVEINCNANGSDGAADCPSGQTCGATAPNVCSSGTPHDGGSGGGGDSGPSCTAKTCTELGYNCGEAVSCETVINCNANGSTTTADCPTGEVCGGGGHSNVCFGGVGSDGGVLCTPKKCAELGFNCGLASNGCDGVLNCNANGSDAAADCPAGEICGYNGVANVCGPSAESSGCDAGSTTALKGFVYDPANHLPVYNALVYVPVGTVQKPTTGINPAAPTCGCTSQPAYVSTFTGIDGSFTLSNPPAGTDVTVVVELGKWQRVYSESITACKTTALSAHLTLPSLQSQGNIPRFAIDTGGVDAMECVLLKMGLDPSEFSDPVVTGGVPTATTRVHFYQGATVQGARVNGQRTNDPQGGAIYDTNTPSETALLNTATVLDSYDVALFPCKGGAGDYTNNTFTNALPNLLSYANAGGRFFATHYHYDLLYGNPSVTPGTGPFVSTANWELDNNSWGQYYTDTDFTSDINTGFATGVVLEDWLHQSTVYGGTLGQIPVGVIRNDFSSVNAPSELWLTTANDTAETWQDMGTQAGPGAGVGVHYTFDTPFNGSEACGRVVYSDFHVESQPNDNEFTGETWPTECPGGTAPTSMTPQEELLEFMLFDLTSCTSPPTCTPLTCASYPSGTCGAQSNGCGGLTADCGTCNAPETCGGGGVANKCGAPDAGSCTQLTCAQQGIQCGPAGNGCGGIIQCPACPTGDTCSSGHCYAPDSGPPVCTPKTCAEQGIQCGVAGDGCGDILQCPPCPSGETCLSTGQCQAGAK